MKFNVLFCEVRPAHWPRATFLPSTITSSFCSNVLLVAAVLNLALLAIRTAKRRAFSSSGIASSSERGSIRPGRVFEPKDGIKADLFQQIVSAANSASVSPGKSTIMSLVMLISRFAALIQAMRSRYCSRV